MPSFKVTHEQTQIGGTRYTYKVLGASSREEALAAVQKGIRPPGVKVRLVDEDELDSDTVDNYEIKGIN